ncbi:hypothetical protein AGDE_04329 [Angomonas deanei]|uniref:Archaic Translocase of outer membrane 14 kDa subunit n=1 Tax=Angomonas deanei TaxID=59799 RepID=A0A7G2CQV4_9TRYP|nr:hypothetical protein AGDE_04329 [Angomonas deanei]CAD2222206.1 hypothetical protein, conserved [Angomonas deanei]|eukprot:EPY39599.1 hypothetical protein AGDE_04329 [Angomonas deanei]
MSAILDKAPTPVTKTIQIGVTAAKSSYTWIQERLWPICSCGIVLTVFHMIAAAQEKQIMADHFYGKSFGEKAVAEESYTDAIVADSKKFFHEEVTVAVKENVWHLSDGAFSREYNDRYGK